MPGFRCLLISSNFPPVVGGSGVVYEKIAEHLPGQVRALSGRISVRDGQMLQGIAQHDAAVKYAIDRLDLLRPRLTGRRPGLLGGVIWRLGEVLPVQFKVWRRVRAIVRDHGVNVVCIGDLESLGWLARPCKRLGCMVLIYVHGEELTINAFSARADRAKRRHLVLAGAVASVSSFTRSVLINEYQVKPENIHLIPNGVDLAMFTPRPRNTGLLARYDAADKRVIFGIGRHILRKGFDRVIEAMPAILQQVPNAVFLCGGSGPETPRFRALAAKCGVTGAVRFIGHIADAELADHYASADVFAMPNRTMPDGNTEGFGLVFLEANACGTPVVAGVAGGAPDAVKHGVNGLAVDGENADEVAQAILRILTGPALADQLKRQGLETARASGWDSRANAFAALCQSLVDGNALR